MSHTEAGSISPDAFVESAGKRTETESVAFHDATDLARLVRTREVSPVDLVELYLGRIARLDDQIGSFVTVSSETALSVARVAQESVMKRDPLPPFLGVPVGIKDVVRTAGVRTTFSSRLFADYVPSTDDASWARMKRAGFLLLGKTNTPELAGADITDSSLNGVCRNPWALERVTGGSSGGSAAAVAAGLCAAADGTDGGGSIRTPASCCGVVGVKPSRGRISCAPQFGDQMIGMVTAGPITRSVRDAAAMLDVMSGYETGDPYWLPAPQHPFAETVAIPLPQARVAWTTATPGGLASTHEQCVDAAKKAAELVGSLGHVVEEATPDWDDSGYLDAVGVLYASWLSYFDIADASGLENLNREELARARSLSLEDYIKAKLCLQRLARRVVSFFDRYDFLITPSLGLPPAPIEWFDWDDLEEMLARSAQFVPVSPIWNVTGQPAISVPLFWSDDGLPIGVQVAAGPAADDPLLRLCAQLEEASPWSHRRPPIS